MRRRASESRGRSAGINVPRGQGVQPVQPQWTAPGLPCTRATTMFKNQLIAPLPLVSDLRAIFTDRGALIPLRRDPRLDISGSATSPNLRAAQTPVSVRP